MKNEDIYLANLSNKDILKDSICCDLTGAEINTCNMDGMEFSGCRWQESEVNNCNVNSVTFRNFEMNEMTFFRSNLERTTFVRTDFINGTMFSGTALLKSRWEECKMNSFTVMNSTMQRATLNRCVARKCIFVDFEAVYASVSNCIFKDCRFEVTFTEGMNGFYGAEIENCIFINCDFIGFPLRSAKTSGCIFIGNTGHVTDDIECVNTLGLAKFSNDAMQARMRISDREAANGLISKWR